MQNQGGNGGPAKITTNGNPKVIQGQYPPQNPSQGDLWLDQFGDVHTWGGHYWVKIQGAVESEFMPGMRPIVPEVKLEPEKCSEAEAEEKLEAFDKIIEPSGRLDVENKGLIAQVEELVGGQATYKTLTTDMLKNFFKDLIK